MDLFKALINTGPGSVQGRHQTRSDTMRAAALLLALLSLATLLAEVTPRPQYRSVEWGVNILVISVSNHKPHPMVAV